MSARLSWSRAPRERGLAGVAYNGTRGWHLKRGGTRLGTVSPLFEGMSRALRGYYFYANVGGESINTAAEADLYPKPFQTHRDAQAACMAWVRARLEAVQG